MKDSASDQRDYIHESLVWFLEELTPDELNQLEDIIVNHYEEDNGEPAPGSHRQSERTP